MVEDILLDSVVLPHLSLSNFSILRDNLSILPLTEMTDVDSWLLMSGPWPMLLITLLYLVFVLRLGPAYMETRPAFQLKNLILLYNGTLVMFSLWWINKVVSEVDIKSKVSCWRRTKVWEEEQYKVNTLMWYYGMSKFVELLDTVFFVLRKKQNQVSFLHVYHHTNMTVFTWAFLKYVRGDQILMIGIVNSGVHAVMYSYYFIAALGPKFNKFLVFKPLITWIQMGQFIFLIGYLLQLLAFGCDAPRRFTQFAVLNTLSFLLLFMNFYHNTYRKSKPKVSVVTENNNISPSNAVAQKVHIH